MGDKKYRTHGLQSDKTISLKVTTSMDAKISKRADKLLISKSELIRSVLNDYLEGGTDDNGL